MKYKIRKFWMHFVAYLRIYNAMLVWVDAKFTKKAKQSTRFIF